MSFKLDKFLTVALFKFWIYQATVQVDSKEGKNGQEKDRDVQAICFFAYTKAVVFVDAKFCFYVSKEVI